MRVYVHGNCQAPAIASLIGDQFPDWEIASYEVFTDKITDEIETYRDWVTNADIIISQPVHDGYRDRDDLSLKWVRASAKPGAMIVVIPSLFFDGQLVGWKSVSFPGYGMPYQDMLVLHCAALGLGANRISAIVLDEELYPELFISEEIRLSIAEMRRREASDEIDVRISPFLERYGDVRPLFHVINHPCRPALAYMANAILSFLGYAAAIPSTGRECLPFPHVPLTKCVSRFLRARGGDQSEWDIEDGERYHLPAATLTPAEYCARVVEHLRAKPREELIAGLQEPHVKPFLRRLAQTVPGFRELVPGGPPKLDFPQFRAPCRPVITQTIRSVGAGQAAASVVGDSILRVRWHRSALSRRAVSQRCRQSRHPGMVVFRPCVTAPVWNHVLVLVCGAILAHGKDTITQALGVMRLADRPGFGRYPVGGKRWRFSSSRSAGGAVVAMHVSLLAHAMASAFPKSFVDGLIAHPANSYVAYVPKPTIPDLLPSVLEGISSSDHMIVPVTPPCWNEPMLSATHLLASISLGKRLILSTGVSPLKTVTNQSGTCLLLYTG